MLTTILLASMLAVPTAGSAQRLVEIRTLINDKGLRSAVSALGSDDARWETLSDDIATGRQEWLDLAGEIRGATDAHTSETLVMALQEALPRNPAGVLALVAGGRFGAADACGMYGFGQIEDERPTRALLELVDRRIAAVSRLKAAKLATARNDCLKELKGLREVLQNRGLDNNALHQTGRGGVAHFLRRGPVVEARPAGEGGCCTELPGLPPS